MQLSVIVITRNEERNIADCLASVSWSDDIVVVDAESTDRTVDIARGFTSRIFIEPWKGFAEAKTFALAQARHDWVLWLDADERVPEDTAQEMRSIASRTDGPSAYRVARRAFFLGKWIRHSGWYPGYVVRLFRRDAGRFTASRVHEGVEVNGSIATLSGDILHFTDNDLEHYFEKFNRYTTLAAEDITGKGGSTRLTDLLLRPAFIFVKMYLLRAGFLDGMHGFILARLSASYVFAKYAKVWARRGATAGR